MLVKGVPGIFPDQLEIAKIVPLFKNDDPFQLDNY